MRYTTRIIVPPRVRRSGPPGTPGGAYGPQVLGVRKSFGFGDRLGVATPAHLAAAAAHPEFAPVFAQQSVREMAATGRRPADVMTAASRAVGQARHRPTWGADADGLRTSQEAEEAAAAGFTCFTIDPSEYIRADAGQLAPEDLMAAIEAMIADGQMPEDWSGPYLDRTIDLPGNQRLRLTIDALRVGVVRYGSAINHCARMYEAIARASHGRPFEIEVAFDGAATPVSALEHLLIGLELEARGVRITSMALRYFGVFEPGIDYGADVEEFEARLNEHAAVAQFCGPYKLSFRCGSDKPAIYPIIARCCGDAFHVKTSGTSYLEAMRVVLRTDLALFEDIFRFSSERFAADRLAYNVSTTPQEVAGLGHVAPGEEEQVYLGERVGRQVLHVTYGSVLTEGRDRGGRPFKDAILELLEQRADLYQEVLVGHFENHLRLLSSG